MKIKRLKSFNVAVSRLIRESPDYNNALSDFLLAFSSSSDASPSPGLGMKVVKGAKSPSVWEARASRDLRVILRKSGPSWYAAHIGHHKPALAWAHDHKIELPKTCGPDDDTISSVAAAMEAAASELPTPTALRTPITDAQAMAFTPFDDRALEEFGVPHAMIPMLRQLRTVDEYIDTVHEQLPEWLGNTLWSALCGDYRTTLEGIERARELTEADHKEELLPRTTPELTEEDLETLAAHPEASWSALPDEQQELIASTEFNGPVLVTGAAGTGKTVVGVQRAYRLATSGVSVMVMTYTGALASFIRGQLAVLYGSPEAFWAAQTEQLIFVDTVDGAARSLRVPARRHRKRPPGVSVYDAICTEVAEHLRNGETTPAYEALIVDEVQDLTPPKLAFVNALAARCPRGVMLLGDMQQRIYGGALHFDDLGLDFGERIFTLDTAYRTTDPLVRLSAAIQETGSASTMPRAYADGAPPRLLHFVDPAEQASWVALAVLAAVKSGVPPAQVAVLARTKKSLAIIDEALFALGLAGGDEPAVYTGTMHSAKGLEFRYVYVIDASAEFLPHPKALNTAATPDEIADAVLRERHVLHVATSRASEQAVLCWVGEPTSFLATAIEEIGCRDGSTSEFNDLAFDIVNLADDPAGFAGDAARGTLGGAQIADLLRDYLSD